MKILRSHTTPQFEKDYLSLPEAIQRKARRRTKWFEENCFLPALDTHKLKGVLSTLWSFSVDDNYRVIFRFLPKREVMYYRVGPHSIYRDLGRLF